MGFAIFFLRRHPCLDIVFFDLPKAKIASTVHDHMVRKLECLHDVFNMLGNIFVQIDRQLVVGLAQYDLFELEEFVHANDAFHVFAVRSGFAAETRREKAKNFFGISDFSKISPS